MNLRIIEKEVEYGVQFDDGYIAICHDEDNAQLIAHLTEGKLWVRDILTSEWYRPEVDG